MQNLTLLACKGSACHAQHVTTMVAYGGLCCVNCLKSVNAAVPSHHIPGSYADARCVTSCPPSVWMHVAGSIVTSPLYGRALALALRSYKSRVPKAYPLAVHESELANALELYSAEASGLTTKAYAAKLQEV